MPSASGLADPKEYQKIFHWAETQKDGSIPSFATRRNDPYKVCANHFESFSVADIDRSTKLVLAIRMSPPASGDSTG